MFKETKVSPWENRQETGDSNLREQKPKLLKGRGTNKTDSNVSGEGNDEDKIPTVKAKLVGSPIRELTAGFGIKDGIEIRLV